ncbi:hypothetical protein BHT94_20845 [Bacillus licheniformis]|nr:hypothetical protein BHT94_20845 [Bacillus licheniformis]
MVNKKKNLQPPLSQIIADELKERIWQGEIQFGERLMEPDLSTELGVSRSSLREAFQMLQHEGIVDITPRKGTFVKKFETTHLQEIYDARLLLEEYSFIRAIRNIKQVHIDKLEKYLRLMKNEINDGNWEGILKLDLDFHEYVVSLCENDLIVKFYSLIIVQIRTFLSRLSLYYDDPNTLYEEHLELLEAIKTRNEEIVKQKIIEHIEDAGKRLFLNKEVGN